MLILYKQAKKCYKMVNFRTRNKEFLHSEYSVPNSCTFLKFPNFKPLSRLKTATPTLKYQPIIFKFTLRFKVALGQQSNVKLHSYDNGFKRFLSISDSIFAKTQQEQWWGTEIPLAEQCFGQRFGQYR